MSVQELGRSVREALHIPDSTQDAFAFWLCSPLLGENLCLFTHTVLHLYEYFILVAVFHQTFLAGLYVESVFACGQLNQVSFLRLHTK